MRRRAASLRAVLIVAAALAVGTLAWGIASAATWPRPRARAAQAPQEASCPMFPADNPLNQDISHAPLDPHSASYIRSIGAGVHLHPSFAANPLYGLPYKIVPAGQPRVPVRFTASPGESDPGPYPVPLDAPVQGVHTDGDHHLLVLQEGTCKLFEMWKAARRGSAWQAGSGAVFDLRSNALRPEGWTSADAAGLPIFPLLARYQEVRAGAINHALRVTVRRTQRGYIHPATHFSDPSSDPNLPPMGLRLRLKASFNLAGYHGQALIVLQALKRYGLIVADDGQPWSIGGATNPGWNEGELHQLETVPGSAFEAVNTGPILRGPAHRGDRHEFQH